MQAYQFAESKQAAEDFLSRTTPTGAARNLARLKRFEVQLAINPDVADSTAAQENAMVVDADMCRSLLLPEIVADDQLVTKDAGHGPPNLSAERIDNRGSEH